MASPAPRNSPSGSVPRPRLIAVDLARSVALAGMIVFHFAFDLQMFGHLPPGTVFEGGWAVLARAVAGSFLFLAGVSLWLGHGQGIRWAAFGRRLAVLAVLALVISVVTWFAMGDSYIRFGILHAMALGSVLGLAFLRVPAILTLVVAVAVLFAGNWLRGPAFDGPWLLWLGLAANRPPMVDYVPMVPWLAPLLAGIAAARLAQLAGLWSRLRARAAPGPLLQALALPGRWSLVVYIVHQPVLVALIWAATHLTGGPS